MLQEHKAKLLTELFVSSTVRPPTKSLHPFGCTTTKQESYTNVGKEIMQHA
jgi:hypothetical protein